MIPPGVLAACDRVKPVVSITNPGQGSSQSGTITVQASATDNDKIKQVQFYLDGSAWGAPITVAPFQQSLSTAGLSTGNHTVSALATDRVGNSQLSSTVSFSAADQHAPSVSINSPGNGATVGGNMLMSAVCSDDAGGSGVYGVVYYIDGTARTGWIGAPYQAYFDTHTLGNGAHTLTVYCNDNAGNQSSQSIPFTINNQPPASGYLNFGDFVLDGVIDRTYVENWDNRFNQNWWWSGTGSKYGTLGLPGNPDPGNYQMQISWSGNYEGASPGTNYLTQEINGSRAGEVFANGFNGTWYNVNGGESIYCYRWSDSPDGAITTGIHCNYRFVVKRGS